MKYLKILPAILLLAPLAAFANSTDRKIEDTAKASYNFRTILDGHVKVSADDGLVTLTGVVQDRDQKDLAADTVENIPGVTSVNNEITVNSDYPEHSDGWIALKIRSRLLMKANVSATDTTVTVHDGAVVLGGTADNSAQKELTADYAKDIEGVKSVKNEITVNAQSAQGETIGETIDDTSITTQVKLALLDHKAVSALGTKVVTEQGVVTVTGEAGSDAERALVGKLAQDVRGVKSVVNNMTVKG